MSMRTCLRYLWPRLGRLADPDRGTAGDLQTAEYTSQKSMVCPASISTANPSVITPSSVPGANHCPSPMSAMLVATNASAQLRRRAMGVTCNTAAANTETARISDAG